MNLPYLIPRAIRHFMPPETARFLLRQGLIIRPGLETSDPGAAVQRYLEIFEREKIELQGRRALIFGYGGSFAVGCGLLEAGAEHGILCDPYAPPDDSRNKSLWPRYEPYLRKVGDRITANPEKLTLVPADIRRDSVQEAIGTADLILSSSVYEHLDDVGGITQALSRVTSRQGTHLHFIDLRDHFFKYPFEMLCYSERTWRRWLNPSSNHNRLRFGEYLQVFEKFFGEVRLAVLSRDLDSFEKARARIRPEFLSGDPQIDAITSIRVLARQPKY